jgi:hypothetical protein
MATGSDPDKAKKYLQADKSDRAEKMLGKDWPLWEKACGFWTEVAIGLKGKLRAALDAINEKSSATGQGQATKDERVAILARAWNAYKEDKKVTPSTCSLKAEHYAVREGSEQKILKDNWTVGGIDVGDPRFQTGQTAAIPTSSQERATKPTRPEKDDAPPTEEGRDADGFPLEDPAAAFASLVTSVPQGDPSEAEQEEIERAKAEARLAKEAKGHKPVRLRQSKAVDPSGK